MRVAHFCRFSPHKSGQYETVKDLIKAERAVGIDAGILATLEKPMPGPPGQPGNMIMPGLQDEWLISQTQQWAADADVLIRHTVIPPDMEAWGKPTVMALHGRPENSWELGHLNRIAVYALIESESIKNQYKKFICFWEDFIYHWGLVVDPAKLEYIPAPVDLEKYNPAGKSTQYGEQSGSPNIIVADFWREDTSPYNAIHAAGYFKKYFSPEAKLQIYGLDLPPVGPTTHLMTFLHKHGITGRLHDRVPNLNEAFRGGDLLITPHVIATRIIREAMACSLPVVAGGGCKYTPYTADPRNIREYATAINGCWKAIQSNREAIRAKTRKTAEKEFDLKVTGEAMKKLLEAL